eukprot:m.439426 g.439426  ORF g.439426 m.439426 type:complete len:254 (-) comp18386_c0_seq1:126-887(-)
MPGASAAQGDQEPAQEETAELMADALPKLREAVKEAHPTDEEPPEEVLCKFLRGCKYNPEKAAKRYGVYRETRAKLFPDQPAHGKLTPDEDLQTVLKMGFIRILPGAKDRCGRQCIYMMPSRMDFSGGKTPARFARCVFYQMETVLEDVETQRNGITMLSNGMGAGRANFSRDVVREILHVIQDCMPLRLGNILMNNEPFFFKIVFKVISLFMKDKMRRRIVILGTDRERLAEYLPKESTPVELDGTYEVPEP